MSQKETLLIASEWAERFNPAENPSKDNGESQYSAGGIRLDFPREDLLIKAVVEHPEQHDFTIWSWVEDETAEADYIINDHLHDAIAYMLTAKRPDDDETVYVLFDDTERRAFQKYMQAA